MAGERISKFKDIATETLKPKEIKENKDWKKRTEYLRTVEQLKMK